jgi:hypothetical protein
MKHKTGRGEKEEKRYHVLSLQKHKKERQIPLYLTQILDISFFFSDAFIACVPWYQSTKSQNQRKPKSKPSKKKIPKHTRWKQINQKGILL